MVMQVKMFLTHNMLESDFYHSSLLPLPMRKKISITVRPVNKGIQVPESCYFQCPFFLITYYFAKIEYFKTELFQPPDESLYENISKSLLHIIKNETDRKRPLFFHIRNIHNGNSSLELLSLKNLHRPSPSASGKINSWICSLMTCLNFAPKISPCSI